MVGGDVEARGAGVGVAGCDADTLPLVVVVLVEGPARAARHYHGPRSVVEVVQCRPVAVAEELRPDEGGV